MDENGEDEDDDEDDYDYATPEPGGIKPIKALRPPHTHTQKIDVITLAHSPCDRCVIKSIAWPTSATSSPNTAKTKKWSFSKLVVRYNDR